MSNESTTRKRLTVAGASVAIGLLLGATILAPNLAGAQESSTTTTSASDASDDRFANRQSRIRSALDDLVTAGTITAAQADAVAADLAGEWPGRGRHGHRLHMGLDVLSTTIGITEAELREALQDGQSIAAVADANGVSAQTVIDAMVEGINTRVDEVLAAGNIDEERAAGIKANAVERATEIVNKERPVRTGETDGA